MHWWHTPPFSGRTGVIHPCKLHYIVRKYLVGRRVVGYTWSSEGSLTSWLFRNLRQLFEIETGKSVWIFHLNPEFLHASQLVDVFSKAFMSFYALPYRVLKCHTADQCWEDRHHHHHSCPFSARDPGNKVRCGLGSLLSLVLWWLALLKG